MTHNDRDLSRRPAAVLLAVLIGAAGVLGACDRRAPTPETPAGTGTSTGGTGAGSGTGMPATSPDSTGAMPPASAASR